MEDMSDTIVCEQTRRFAMVSYGSKGSPTHYLQFAGKLILANIYFASLDGPLFLVGLPRWSGPAIS
jgi:hypothetical protein